ncbi:hypothetical protein G9A89_016436 [Geosiphon pyriformis]|nr:hypothetical protein G9A89_016436 [Geosiphon pyriformis]
MEITQQQQIQKDLNSETLAIYFQELNFNIIKYCEEKYPVQCKYSFEFELETKTSNKGKQRLKQYSRTTPNTLTLQKTTAKHLQTPKQETSVKLPLSITPFPISLKIFSHLEILLNSKNQYQQENESNHSESLESKETESEPEEIPENEEEMATAYIAKIPEFTGENNDTSPQEWLDKVQKAGDANGWIAARMLKAIPYFLQGIAEEWFENLEEPFENWQAFKNFITGLKDKLIKKVHPHAPADLATAIKHAKSYEMAMKEVNHTKLVNLAIGKTSSAAEEKINQLTKKQQQPERYQPPQQHNQNNFRSSSNNQSQNCHYCGIPGHWKQDCRKLQRDQQNRSNQHYSSPQQSYYQSPPPTYYSPRPQNQNSYYLPAPQSMQQQYQQPLPIQPYQTPLTQQYQVLARKLVQYNQFTPQNQLQNNHNRINPNNQLVPRNSGQQRPNYYHTQPSYLTIPEESDFQQTALSEGEIAAPRSNSSNHTILPAQIAQNANLSDIFPFEFEANESPFLLSNAAVNEQKAITAMYTEATVEEKPICLILDSGSARSIITYQLMQQLKQNKTPVGEIDDFPFSIDGITISVKVLIMDAPQYQALVGNDWLLKANANLNWET